MSNPNYVINDGQIMTWPPCAALRGRSADIELKQDGNNSSVSFKGDVEFIPGGGVGDHKINFKPFKLYVTLPRDTSVSSGKDKTFVKNRVELQFKMNDFKATAVIDFAKFGRIVQESLMIMGVPMELPKSQKYPVLEDIKPMLFVTMQAVDAKKSPLFQPDGGLPPPGEMYKKSIEDPAGFWFDIASKFYSKPSKNPDVTKGKGKGKINNIEGFKRGVSSKNNICHHCLDKNIESGKGDNDALIWEGNELNVNDKLTYRELLKKVCQLANFLKDKFGVKKGDNVIIFLPMIMELPITMLACARIGAVQLVVVAVYSSKSLFEIIMKQKPKIVVTCYAVMKTREGKEINLKETVDTALLKANAALSKASQTSQTAEKQETPPEIVKCLTYGNESAMKKEATKWKEDRDFWWQDTFSKLDDTCDVEPVDAQKPLFILYTSESTGKPKEQTTGDYMIYTTTTFKCAFDCKESDVYWCTTDDGWITDTMHSYVTYGPLLNGATVVLYEGFPDYPDAGRCWNIVDKHKVTLFYTVPKLVRSLKGAGDQYVTRSSRKSLRVLGCVGEPLEAEEWRWFFNVVGDSKYPTSEIWKPNEPGSDTFPFFAVKPVIVDEKGVEIDDEGIVIKGSWQGTFRILYGDQKTTEKKLFSVHYFKDEETQASTSST